MNIKVQEATEKQEMLVFPKAILDAMNLKNGDDITVKVIDGKTLIIEKLPKYKTAKELFEGWNGTYDEEEVDWGAPVGDEVW